MYIIYKHTNKINGKSYVGQTKYTMERRLKGHLSSAKRASSKTKPFHLALAKYGIKAFESTVIETGLNKEEASRREIYWIKKVDSFCNGYNATLGGDYFDGYVPKKGREHHAYKTKEYTFYHKKLGSFTGTCWDFADAYNLSRGSVSKLTSDGSDYNSMFGWVTDKDNWNKLSSYRRLSKECPGCNKKIEKTSNTCMQCKPKAVWNCIDCGATVPRRVKRCVGCRPVKAIKPVKAPETQKLNVCPKCLKKEIGKHNKTCWDCRDTSGKNNSMYGKKQSQKTKDAVSKRRRGDADKTLRDWVNTDGRVELNVTCLELRDKYPELNISKLNAIAKQLMNKKGYRIGVSHNNWSVVNEEGNN